MTKKEILNLPEFTPIKAVAGSTAYKPYLDGGELVFQDEDDRYSNEYVFGISTIAGTCYMFEASELELL
jgi:hypothetical protein